LHNAFIDDLHSHIIDSICCCVQHSDSICLERLWVQGI
jgi:hypothetical protein